MYKKDDDKSKQNVNDYVKRAKSELGPMKEKLGESHRDHADLPHGHDDHELASVREAMHHGKHIVVKTHYEVIVLGSGNAGMAAAGVAREAGKSVAMVESWVIAHVGRWMRNGHKSNTWDVRDTHRSD